MKYRWGLGLILASMLLIGCGTGSDGKSTKSDLKERDVIIIEYNTDPDVCKSAKFQVVVEQIVPYASNMIFSVEKNSVTCATYGRQASSDGNCQIDYLDSYKNSSCVIGYNVPDKYKL